MAAVQNVPKSPLPLFIKNTFIDVEEEEALDPRRSSSEPPSCRHRDSEPFSSCFNRKCSLDLPESTASGPESPRGSVSDDISDDGTATVNMSPTPLSKLNPDAAEWSPMKVPPMWLPPADLPPPPPPPPAPTGSLPALELILSQVPRFFQRQFRDIMMSGVKTLSDNDAVDDVDFGEGEGSWGKGLVVKGRMSAKVENFDEKKKAILAEVKETILQSADVSKSIYVMGYALMPFTETENGFSAMLGGVGAYFGQTKYEEGYCWDMITKGFCCDEGMCCREHPATMLPIYVEIRKISDSGRWSDIE